MNNRIKYWILLIATLSSIALVLIYFILLSIERPEFFLGMLITLSLQAKLVFALYFYTKAKGINLEGD